MFIVRLIRKFFSLFRSDLTGHEVALGFCLGILMGCIPLSSAWAVAVVLLLAVVFRTAISAFIAAALLVKALAFAIDPVLFELGQYALEGPTQGFFAWMVNKPVLALLDLHRYVVTGGIVFSLLASLICYPLFFFLTRKYRTAILYWTENSPGFARFTRFPLIRFFTWLLMGKKKGDYRETLALRKSPIRKKALVLIISFVVVVSLFTVLFGDAVAKAGFEGGLSRAMDADVSTRRLALSFLHGSLDLADFLVLEQDEKNQIVKAVKFESDLNVQQLLKRHLVFDEIKIENMDFHVERDETGRINLERKREAEARKKKKKESPDEGFDLSDLWEQRELAEDVIEKVLDVLFPAEGEGDRSEEWEETKQEKISRKDYASLYADFLLESNQPLFVIDDLWIKGLALKLKDRSKKGSDRAFEKLALHATALSSAPSLYGRDCLIELGDDNLENPTFRLEFLLNWSKPNPVHRLAFSFTDLAAEKVLSCLRPGDRLLLKDGTIALESATLFKKGGIESVNRVRLSGLSVAPAKPGGKIMGLDGELFSRGLTEFLKSSPLETVVKLDGPYGGLKIEVDEKGLIDSVKEGIQRTGDRLLQEEFNRQAEAARALVDEKLDKLEKRLDEKTDKLQKKLEEKAGEELEGELGKQLDGLLKGKDDKKKGLLDGVDSLFGGKGKKKEDENKKKKKEGDGRDRE